MKKRLVALLIAIIILTTAVYADGNFSIQKSYDWLLKQQSDGSYGTITDNAAAILALKAAGYNPTNTLEYLTTQESEQYCWPKTGCRTKDTAFVMLANKIMGVATEETANWMRNAQTAALQTGNWWLEVATTESGTCSVKYTKNGQEITKTIKVDNGRFTDCGNTTFLNINNCIETNLVRNFPTIKLYVDCGTLSNALISLIYNSANSYYLITDSQNKVAEIDIENGCLGIGYRDATCNYESTLYANWALMATESKSISRIYLGDNYDKTNVLHNSLLFLIFNDNKYLEELKSRQRSDGSWDGDVYKTAMAALAMKEAADYSSQFNNGVNWLKTKQRADGSFGDTTTTAMVLYGAFTEGGIDFPSCTNGKKDFGERGVDCGGNCEQYDDCCSNDAKDDGEDGKDCGGICEECVCDKDDTCDTDQGEDCQNCPEDCKTCEDLCDNGEQDAASGEEGIDCGGKCKACKREVCDNNGICDIDSVYTGRADENENIENCPNDCGIGDGICDDKETYENSPDDCKKPEGCGDGTCDETETQENCPEDCETECNSDGICDENEGCICEDCKDDTACQQPSTFPWTLVIILLILLLAIAGYLFYKKKTTKKKGPELFGFGKPVIKKIDIKEFKPVGTIKETKEEKVTVTPPKTQQAPSRIEQELEKSIKEAKRLIGKK